MPRDDYFGTQEVDEDSIVSDEPETDEWEDQPTTPRFRHSNIGENLDD